MFIDWDGKEAEDIPCIVDHLLDKPPSQGHENIKKSENERKLWKNWKLIYLSSNKHK